MIQQYIIYLVIISLSLRPDSDLRLIDKVAHDGGIKKLEAMSLSVLTHLCVVNRHFSPFAVSPFSLFASLFLFSPRNARLSAVWQTICYANEPVSDEWDTLPTPYLPAKGLSRPLKCWHGDDRILRMPAENGGRLGGSESRTRPFSPVTFRLWWRVCGRRWRWMYLFNLFLAIERTCSYKMWTQVL